MGLFTKKNKKKENGFGITEAFHLAYSRSPVAKDLDWLSSAGIKEAGGKSDVELLRSVIAACDRQVYPTPVTVRFSAANLTVANLDSFKLIVDKDDISVSTPILASRDYEFHLRRVIERVLKPGMTAIDIGANIGFYSMLLASLVGPEGAVLAFEPNSENNRLILLSKIENAFENVQLYPLALSDFTGAAFFSPMLGSNGGLLPDTPETLKHPNCVVVAAQRLDDLFHKRVDFMKVDVEGAEYRALLGAKEILLRHHPFVTTEFSMEMMSRVSGIAGGEFLKWMISLGYAPHLIPRDGSALQPITEVDSFIANWGDPVRIEDLAFLPLI